MQATGTGRGRDSSRQTQLARELAQLLMVIEPPSWMGEAACRELPNADVMFPTAAPGTARYAAEVAAARAVCAECPVRGQCLTRALRMGEDEGVWGGLDPAERRAINQDWATADEEAA